MTGRLTLICCGSTDANRRGAFPCDEPLEPAAVAQAQKLAGRLPRADRIWHGPALRAAQTADALGLGGRAVESLRDRDFGKWAGRGLAELDPADLAAWVSDPAIAPHGGESLENLRRRVCGFLEESLGHSGHTLAITHASVIRAAVCEVLEAPAGAFWRLDVEPLSLTRLTSDGRRWALRIAASR